MRSVQPNLYPTVGLQTPGEVVEANFGHLPFVFDIKEYMKDWHMKTKLNIERFPVSDRRGEWTEVLQKLVSTYLVHHGYCATAESFCKATAQPIEEELTSIKHRQRIQKLVLAGRMGEAIDFTQQTYPGLLEREPNLLFMLKCRQFVEMVNGVDSEIRRSNSRSPRSYHGGGGGNGSSRSSPSLSPSHNQSGNASSSAPHIVHPLHHPPQQLPRPGSGSNSPNRLGGKLSRSSTPTSSSSSSSSSSHHSQQQHVSDNMRSSVSSSEEMKNAANASPQSSERYAMNGSGPVYIEGEENMDLSDGMVEDGLVTNGSCNPPPCMNGSSHPFDAAEEDAEDMDVDGTQAKMCGGDRKSIEKMLEFGRDLQSMSQRLRREHGHNDTNKKAIQDAFSLLAYPDPWNSPVGFQLQAVQREPVCAALNSAILASQGLPKQPPLKLAIAQASQCLKLMAKNGIGGCAFAKVSDYLH